MPDHRDNNRRNAASGLRKIATLRTLANSAKPRERHQLANRFARLENERARLEREVSTWENSRAAAAVKLAKVIEEIEAIGPALFEPPAHHAAFRKGHGAKRALAETQLPGSKAPHKRVMTLEY